MTSEEQLVAATGRTYSDWFSLLDSAGAHTWDIKRVDRWLGGKHAVDEWWAQSVSRAYVSARGDHGGGQSADGTFQVSVSREVKFPTETIWPFMDDDELRRSWLDVELEVLGQTDEKTLRLAAADGSRIVINLLPERNIGKPDEAPEDDSHVRVLVQHSRLAKESMKDETAAFWTAALANLVVVLSDAAQD